MWQQIGYHYKLQLDNWMRWTRIDYGRPDSFRSGMPQYKSKNGYGDDTMPVEPIVIVAELDARRFDALVMTLTPFEREIFKIEFLDIKKKKDGFRYVRWADMNRKFALLNLARSTYMRRLLTIEQSLKHRGSLE
jgi:hypothetical protein